MSISVTLETETITQALKGLRAIFNRKETLSVIGAAGQQAVLERFHESKKHFAPNAQSTKKRKKGDNPLHDTGTLMNSITYKTSLTNVSIGSAVTYAEDVHDGDKHKNQPPRPYLADGSDMQKTIDTAL